ncbi:MAG: VCBS repeat-containing protein, partial [Bacteroidota bacterium]|nr:VCBS repeat-containing protein [Bacteroidota bacterium]
MRRFLFINMMLCFVLLSAKAQQYEDFGFEQRYDIAVKNLANDSFDMPWLGGMNACQFCEMDFDFDGVKDLLVFDRHGSRIYTFINNGIENEISYYYAPEYEVAFPHFDNWVQFHDYDNDGKNDIFTYTLGGIMIYKNISHDGEMKFEKVIKRYLTSLQGNLFTNILVTSVDYPAIVDVDSDGDLDVLTFWGLGSFVEYHQNQSMEKYGVPDSLLYHKQETCWGYFAESDEANTIYLDTCINGGVLPPSGAPKHTGSTFLVYDFENDGDKDLVLGDVDYPGLVALTNGGDAQEAVMVEQNWDFPNEENAVNMFSFPVAVNIDVNNDNAEDLIISSFDPSFNLSRFKNNTLLYLNNGSEGEYDFEYTSDNFLQGEMLDFGAGAYPVIVDLDNDGLKDIVVANYGQLDSIWYDVVFALHCNYKSSLAFLKNIGTAETPAFKIMTEDLCGFMNRDFGGLYPAFGDLDEDGDVDIICGNEEGNLILCENIGSENGIPQFVITNELYGDIDVGYFSAPQLYDINKDGLIDLVVGEKEGNLNYYENIGTSCEPVFSFVTEMLGGVDVTNINLSYQGYSIPCFFDDKG